MADLGALMKTSPWAAGYMISQQAVDEQKKEAIERDRLKQVIADLQQKNRFNEDLHPYDVESKKLGNQYDSQVKIPSGLQDLQAKTMGNDFTRATQPGKIAATNSDYDVKQGQDKEALAMQMQGRIARLAASTRGMKGPAAMLALREGMQAEGFNPDSPMSQKMLQRLQALPPEKWEQHFRDLSDQIGQYHANLTPQYQGQVLQSNANLMSHQITADASRDNAKTTADSRMSVAKQRASALTGDIMTGVQSGKVPPDRAAVQMQMLYELADPDDPKKELYGQLASKFNQMALDLKKEPPTADPNAVGIQTVPPKRPVLGAPSQATAAPQGTASNPIVLK